MEFGRCKLQLVVGGGKDREEMSETFYKPLTPNLRSKINSSIEKQMQELRTCQSNVFVSMQMEGLRNAKNLINRLPDGYPMPMKRNNG